MLYEYIAFDTILFFVH